MNLTITANGLACVVNCKDEFERDSAIRECERDGYEFRDTAEADAALESIDYFDWNPA